MAIDTSIKSGLWTIIYDYDRSWIWSLRQQIVVTESTSRKMIAWIAVLLSLTIPFFFLVIHRSISASLIQGSHQNAAEDVDGSVLTALRYYWSSSDEHDQPPRAIKKMWDSTEGPVALPNDETPDMFPAIGKSLIKDWRIANIILYNPRRVLAFILIAIIYLSLFTGSIAVAIYCADLAGDSVVSSSTPNAGAWITDKQSAAFLLGDSMVIKDDKQSRVWAYKNECYGESKPYANCETFYTRRLPYVSVNNATCPFDGDVCLYGDTGAYKITTGLMDSNVLGINAEASKRFHFRKTMVCSPLKSDEYVFPEGKSIYPNQYLYDYGPFRVGGTIYDKYTYRNAMEWRIYAEDESLFTLSPWTYVPKRPLLSSFQPHDEFRAGTNTVSIIFISTAGDYYYVFESNDPVFPAHTKTQLEVSPGQFSTFWINNITKAGVLGCVDSHEICTDRTGSRCWDQTMISHAHDEISDDIATQRAFYLLTVALKDTDVWRLIDFLEADVLLATQQVRRIIGIMLDPEQWKVEARSIFEASLAAMQINVYDYARGMYASHPNMIDSTPRRLDDPRTNIRAAVDISKMVKFRNMSYTNVPAVWFWFTNIICSLIFLGSRKFSNHTRQRYLVETTGRSGYHNTLWIYIFWRAWVVAAIRNLWVFTGWIFSTSYNKLAEMLTKYKTKTRTSLPDDNEPNGVGEPDNISTHGNDYIHS